MKLEKGQCELFTCIARSLFKFFFYIQVIRKITAAAAIAPSEGSAAGHLASPFVLNSEPLSVLDRSNANIKDKEVKEEEGMSVLPKEAGLWSGDKQSDMLSKAVRWLERAQYSLELFTQNTPMRPP